MSVVSKTTLKTYFESGDRPNQSNFTDLIDSLAAQGATGTPLYPDLGVNPGVYAITATGVSAYVSGQNYSVLWGNTNASASTLNVNGLGATAIRYANNAALTGSELPQNGIGTVYYNGTTGTFQLPNINPATTGAVTSLTGDVTGTGPGAAVTTLASTAVSAGIYANPTIIVDAKGRITSATAGSVSAGALTKIASAAASNSTTIDFVNGSGGVVINSTYNTYLVVINSLIPANDGALTYMRTSTNAGSSYDSGAGDYGYYLVNNGTPAQTTATQIPITTAVGNTSGRGANSVVKIYNPGNSAVRTVIGIDSNFYDNAGNETYTQGTAARRATADVDAIRFVMSTGNITSGSFQLYGVS